MIKMPRNVGNKKQCYGCGICATICPHRVIDIKRNKLGFFVPVISNPEACTDCGLCSRICSYEIEDGASFDLPILSLAAWSNNPEVRKVCSSGGIGYEIALQALKSDFDGVCAVRYNALSHQPEHYIAKDEAELRESVGSKYLQSYTIPAFKQVKTGGKYVIIGTPCQIDMWRRYLRWSKKEDGYILIDFFCHGVPSYNIWQKYISEKKAVFENASTITWRDKTDGWHSSWNVCAYDNPNFWTTRPYYRSKLKDGDSFFFMFLSNCQLNPACYTECKYKGCKSSADIRLGDLWGAKYKNNESGVSAVLVFTEIGKSAISPCDITTLALPVEIVMEGQMKKNIAKPWYYGLCTLAVKSRLVKLSSIRKAFIFCEILKYQISKLKKSLI